MRPFEYSRAPDLAQAAQLGAATGQGQSDAPTQYLAGGTTLIDLMKLDVLRPRAVVDLRSLRARFNGISIRPDGLHLGAFASMASVADDARVQREYPAIADSLKLAASAQLRNMATLGGNVLQKTRCPFYRDPTFDACNKRTPGSGCHAMRSFNRNHAILGTDASCIAQYPGDLAVVLIALEAEVNVTGPRGERTIPFSQLHIGPAGRPDIETSLRGGEIITAFHIPAAAWNARSLYLKVRDRASYEFAVSSCAAAIELDGDVVGAVRLGLGGLAYRPWRAHEAERVLTGKPLTTANVQAAAAAALRGAITHGRNDFKRELGERTIVRALLQARAMSVPGHGA
jgi:xanthine dehydrogenase YagS FAD-binding subunit